MPASTLTTSRTTHPARAGRSGHTSLSRISLLSSFAKTLRPISESTPLYTPANNLERTLSNAEEKFVRQVLHFLSPTFLHPFQAFKRPWPKHPDYHPSATTMVASDRALIEKRLLRLVSDFVDQFPQLLCFENDQEPFSPEAACVESMQLRRIGHCHQAVCVLHKAIVASPGSSDILRLHKMDILSELRLHSTSVATVDDYAYPLSEEGCIPAALRMFAYARHLVQRLPPGDLAESTVSEQVKARMLGTPWNLGSTDELYARICYAHILVMSMRFVSVVEERDPEAGQGTIGLALERLLELSRVLNADAQVDQIHFLRWRCTQSLKECIPFPDPTLGIPESTDIVSAMATTSRPRSPPLAVLQAWWNGEEVQTDHFLLLLDHLDQTIRLKDTREIDDLLQAIQLIDHPDLASIRKALRLQSWHLHRKMLPESPWILDGGLQYPTHLWVAVREKDRAFHVVPGAAPGTRSLLSQSPHASSQQLGWISHLQFGFGDLASKQESNKWVYAWSLLYQCIQHSPSPYDDRLYSLLVKDSDLFSWSQFCQRLRYICRSRLVTGNDAQELRLDGATPQLSNLAGLGRLSLVASGQDPVPQLNEKITRLRELRQGLLELAQPASSVNEVGKNDLTGLRNLAGIALAWIGLARLECGSQLLDRLRGRSGTLSSGLSAILVELRGARKDLLQAVEEGRALRYGLMLREAGDGLLALHDILFDLEQPSGNEQLAVTKAASRLLLCEQLQDDLRSAVIQTFATPGYKFTVGDRCVTTGTPLHLVSQLYRAAQSSLFSEGKFRHAADWLSKESEDVALGEAMAVKEPQWEERHVLSSDADLMMSGDRFPAKHQLNAYLDSTAMTDIPSPTPDVTTPTTDVETLIRAIPPSVGPTKIIQFGCKDEEIIVYATDLQGRVHHCPCEITQNAVLSNTALFRLKSGIEDEEVSMFRPLDVLASSIVDLTAPDELLILIPGVLGREIPFQMLEAPQGANRITLSERNPIVYAPSPHLVQRCIERGLDGGKAQLRQRRVVAASNFSGGRPDAIERLASAARHWAQELGGTAITESEVTFDRMQEEFEQRELALFLGHGSPGLGPDGTITLPKMRFRQGEYFTQYHMAHTALPDSCMFLFGCNFARVRVHHGAEYQSMALTSLLAGSLATVGTMYTIVTRVASPLGKKLASKLKPFLDRHDGHTIVNLARILQESLNEIRHDFGPNRWGPFVLHGTPVLLIGHSDEAQGTSRSA